MKIDFYYWKDQCPINNEMIQLLKEYETSFDIHYYDISLHSEHAVRERIYFPFLTVINNDIRLRGPLKRSHLEQLKAGIIPQERPYIISHSDKEYIGELIELNEDTIHRVSEGCSLKGCKESCILKKQFLSQYSLDFYGYLHIDNDKVVGGVEYVPSLIVPYDMPKDEKTAFLTCVYHSSTEYDYKAYPLRVLEERLFETYDRIIAITSEKGTFPNGDLQWFIKQGYKDEGIISIEEHYTLLHLVSKSKL